MKQLPYLIAIILVLGIVGYIADQAVRAPLGDTPTTTTISWEQAVSLIESCQVTMVAQTHARDVYLDLKDGRRAHAVEPKIDMVFPIVQSSGCPEIPLATE